MSNSKYALKFNFRDLGRYRKSKIVLFTNFSNNFFILCKHSVRKQKSKTLPLLWYLLFSVFYSIKILFFFSGLLLFPVISDWPHHKLLEKTLYLQVIDYDRFSRDDPIGEITLPLNEVDLTQKKSTWRFLEPCKESRVSWYLYFFKVLGKLTSLSTS